MKNFFRAVLLTMLVSAQSFAQPTLTTIPRFTFYKLDKTPFTNKNIKPGKLSLIIFFDATCDHCQHALQTYNQHYNELKKINLYLVTLDTPAAITDFMTKYANHLYGNKNVTILRDLKNEFITAFRPRRYPSMFLYSPQSKLILYDDRPENVPAFLKNINESTK